MRREPLRTLITSQQVDQLIDKLREDHPRFENFWTGWTWRLVRAPTKDAVPVPGRSGWWIIKTSDWISVGLPQIRILYHFDNNEICIELINPVAAQR